ncbi:hypothetical protein EDB89DRAFT_2050596, partial [Lactarius sanguifluus]
MANSTAPSLIDFITLPMDREKNLRMYPIFVARDSTDNVVLVQLKRIQVRSISNFALLHLSTTDTPYVCRPSTSISAHSPTWPLLSTSHPPGAARTAVASKLVRCPRSPKSLSPYCSCLMRMTRLGAAASWSKRCAGARGRRLRVRFVVVQRGRYVPSASMPLFHRILECV